MKLIFGLFAILLAIAIGIMFYQNKQIPFLNLKSQKEVMVKNQTFKVDLAKTSEETQTGLSKKTSLPQNQGMLFVFEKEGYYSFWMKEMKFPIDIIFINKNKIVNIFQNVQPPKSETDDLPIYKPEELSDSVFEINAGLSQKYGFQKGDNVIIK